MQRCTAHVEGMTPEAVIFTVDFFNAIYVATCMQTASSAAAVTAIAVTQTSVMVYDLHRRTATIRAKLGRVIENSARGNIVIMACSVCRDLEKFKNQSRTDTRIRSCLPHLISPADSNLLNSLERMSNGIQHRAKTPKIPILDATLKHCKLRSICTLKNTKTVHPILPSANNAERVKRKPQHLHIGNSTVLRETLETMFTTECIIVTAYLEAVVPLFYSGYILMMVHVQSAQYHTEMEGITPENVSHKVLPVFVFAFLQLVSFVLLAVVIKRNCGVRALYQLAFVLETQMTLIQGKLMLWMMITFCFRVVHFGKAMRFMSGIIHND